MVLLYKAKSLDGYNVKGILDVDGAGTMYIIELDDEQLCSPINSNTIKPWKTLNITREELEKRLTAKHEREHPMKGTKQNG